jgi:RNA polymerase sigma-70 factor (ECF subfamily)
LAVRKTQAAAAERVASDEERVSRCLTHDEAAVRMLTSRYSRRLFRMARGILRNDAEAEDVVQETYMRAFTGLERFRGEAAFGTWLTRIALNEALGRLRRRRPPTVEWAPDSESGLRGHILRFAPASAEPR